MISFTEFLIEQGKIDERTIKKLKGRKRIPDPLRVSSVRLPKHVQENILSIANATNQSESDVMRKALTEYADKNTWHMNKRVAKNG